MKISVLRWDAGICEGSEYAPANEGGFLTVQPDRYGEEQSGGAGGIVQHPFGFLGRPADPEGQDACQSLYAYEGDQLHIIPTQDARALAKLPPLKKGGSIQYSSNGSFGSFDPETRTYTVFVPIEVDGDGNAAKSHALTIGRANDETGLVSLVHANGMGLLMQDDGNNSVILKNSDGSASIVLDDSGQINLAGIVRLVSGVAAGSPAGVPLARAPELIEWAASVLVTLGQIAAYINALAPGSVVLPDPLPVGVATTMIKSD